MSDLQRGLLFAFPEDTFLRAFVFASLTVGISTGLVLEFRLLDPLGTYQSAAYRRSYARQVFQTSAAAFCATLFTLVFLRVLFGMGESMLSRKADSGA